MVDVKDRPAFQTKLQEVRFLGGLMDNLHPQFCERNAGFGVCVLSVADYRHPVSQRLWKAIEGLYIDFLEDNVGQPFLLHPLLVEDMLEDIDMEFEGSYNWILSYIDAFRKLGASEPWA